MELPVELLWRVFSCLYGDEPVLDIKARLRAHLVCTSWRSALKDMPATIGGLDEKVCRWLVKVQPPVERLDAIVMAEGFLPAVLHSLPSKALKELLISGELIEPCALPRPSSFEHLRVLEIYLKGPVSAWLSELTPLQHLQRLDLRVAYGRKAGLESVVLPALVSLTELSMYVDTLDYEHVSAMRIGIPVQDLTSLRSLDLTNFGGAVFDLTVGGGAGAGSALELAAQLPPLSVLSLNGGQLVADFSRMPQLKTLKLADFENVVGASTVSASTSLAHLNFFTYDDEHVWGMSLQELLRCAPSSLRTLALTGPCPPELMEAIGSLGQLQALALGLYTTDRDQLPPINAPLWRNLRGLSWGCLSTSLAMPEALSAASQLQRLHLWCKSPSEQDLALISSLPELRHLVFENLSESNEQATLSRAAELMPNLLQLCGRKDRTSFWLEFKDFVKDFVLQTERMADFVRLCTAGH